ncbi:MAG: hypothetical protein JXB46_05890 [Candidatus Eisenbacteria bacterium]|nr:hypothetical protein [Candidatus Eisenbacteria bacterium]
MVSKRTVLVGLALCGLVAHCGHAAEEAIGVRLIVVPEWPAGVGERSVSVMLFREVEGGWEPVSEEVGVRDGRAVFEGVKPWSYRLETPEMSSSNYGAEVIEEIKITQRAGEVIVEPKVRLLELVEVDLSVVNDPGGETADASLKFWRRPWNPGVYPKFGPRTPVSLVADGEYWFEAESLSRRAAGSLMIGPVRAKDVAAKGLVLGVPMQHPSLVCRLTIGEEELRLRGLHGSDPTVIVWTRDVDGWRDSVKTNSFRADPAERPDGAAPVVKFYDLADGEYDVGAKVQLSGDSPTDMLVSDALVPITVKGGIAEPSDVHLHVSRARTGRFEVTVLGRDGKPSAGAMVRMGIYVPERKGIRVPLVLSSDGLGKAATPLLECGRMYQVEVLAKDEHFMLVRRAVLEPGVNRLTVAYDGILTVTGEVKGPDGEGVEAACRYFLAMDLAVANVARTQADGRFSVEVLKEHFPLLLTFRALCDGPGVLTSLESVVLESLPEEPLHIRLRRAESRKLTVRYPRSWVHPEDWGLSQEHLDEMRREAGIVPPLTHVGEVWLVRPREVAPVEVFSLDRGWVGYGPRSVSRTEGEIIASEIRLFVAAGVYDVLVQHKPNSAVMTRYGPIEIREGQESVEIVLRDEDKREELPLLKLRQVLDAQKQPESPAPVVK